MLTLLAALLLSGPPSARAQESTAVSAPALSGKERRHKRRADRKARRGEKGPYGEILGDEEADAADAAESSARTAAAAGKAAGAAAALKGSLPSADAGGGMPGASVAGESPPNDAGGAPSRTAGTPAAAPSGFTAGASGDPGRPQAPSDFALAARSGYTPAFAAAGLKLGPDGRSVLRLDGKPAAPEDYARLQREIGALPAALGRRPDFFSIVSPAHYADLKRGYKEKKDGDPVYKDVGTTEGDRDFVHTASCAKLSGDCNKSVEKASYKKGDFVAPEDLDSMWNALQKELDGSAEAGGLPSLGAARSGLARETALGAARALSPAYSGQQTDPSGAAAAAKAPGSTPVSRAAASVGKLWKRASALAFPRTGGSPEGGSGVPAALGALALAALAGGALFMRRKG